MPLRFGVVLSAVPATIFFISQADVTVVWIVIACLAALAGWTLWASRRLLQRRRDAERARQALADARQRLLTRIPALLAAARQYGHPPAGLLEQIAALQNECVQVEADMQRAAGHTLMARLHRRLEQQLLQCLQDLLDTPGADAAELARLRLELAELQARLAGCHRALRATVRAYRQSSAGLPGALLARLLRLQPLAEPPAEEAGAEELRLEPWPPWRDSLPDSVQEQLPAIAALHAQVQRQSVLLLVIVSTLAIALMAYGLRPESPLLALPAGIVLLATGLLLSLLYLQANQRRVRQWLLPGLLREVHAGLNYVETGCVDTPTFNRARLFPPADRLHGQGFIYGSLPGGRVELAWVEAQARLRQAVRDARGVKRYRGKPRTLFRGLFLVLQLPQPVAGSMCLRARGMPAPPPSGPGAQPWHPVPVDDEAFASLFTVYAADLVQAHCLLDAACRQRLQRIHEQLGPFDLLVHDKQLFVACAAAHGLLQQAPWCSLAHQQQHLWRVVQVVGGVLSDLCRLQGAGDVAARVRPAPPASAADA